MGEMADYYAEQGIDALVAEWAEDEAEAKRRNHACAHCGKKGLMWMKRCGKFRLGNGKNVHVCDAYIAAKANTEAFCNHT